MSDKDQQEQKHDLEKLLLIYSESRATTNDALVLLTYLRQQTEIQETIVKISLKRQRKLERVIKDLREQIKKPDDLKVEFYVNKNKDIDNDE